MRIPTFAYKESYRSGQTNTTHGPDIFNFHQVLDWSNSVYDAAVGFQHPNPDFSNPSGQFYLVWMDDGDGYIEEGKYQGVMYMVLGDGWGNWSQDIWAEGFQMVDRWGISWSDGTPPTQYKFPTLMVSFAEE
jgi:hypothetical protein